MVVAARAAVAVSKVVAAKAANDNKNGGLAATGS
jgi:hypothetical protein